MTEPEPPADFGASPEPPPQNGLDTWRLAVGTWTIVRVAPPRRIDRTTASGAMLLGPLLGALIGVVAAAVAVIVRLAGPGRLTVALLAAVAIVTTSAIASRGLHLDGLADTVDAFASSKRDAAALDIMRKSDIGPFGVVALVLVLAAQVVAYTSVITVPRGLVLVIVAMSVGRLCATVATRHGQQAARPDGLGATVVGSVPIGLATAVSVVVVGCSLLASLLLGIRGPFIVGLGIGLAIALTVALTDRATKRFGGLTGDTLGACVEVGTTCVLVASALFLGR